MSHLTEDDDWKEIEEKFDSIQAEIDIIQIREEKSEDKISINLGTGTCQRCGRKTNEDVLCKQCKPYKEMFVKLFIQEGKKK